jgi:hypothetical protein
LRSSLFHLPRLPAWFQVGFLLPGYTVALISPASEPFQDLSTSDDVTVTAVPLWWQYLSASCCGVKHLGVKAGEIALTNLYSMSE